MATFFYVVNINGIRCQKFQRIPSLMALTLTYDTNSQWFRPTLSLSNILKVDMFLSKNRIAIFLKQKKSNDSKHMKGFQLLEIAISSTSGQSCFD